ncbi:MAG: hypothetical protein EAZ89_03585, partial [Bacteroidetes bacterium]
MRRGYIRFLKFFSLLNPPAQERFTSYLHYRFHGKDPRLLQWFGAVRDSGSYELAWERCFPGKEYRSSVAFQLSEQITKAIESFIAIEALEERPAQKNDLLLRFLIRQKDPELFYSSLKEARKQLEAQAFRSEEYFRQR